MKNIVAATFQPGYTTAKVLGLWQYDYGQILRIQGLELPDAVEIHFSLQEKGGESERQVGLTRDGVTEVAVPNSYLENAGTSRDYSIYAFLYISDGKSGNTEYKITMYVQSRPEPKDPETPEDPKDDPFGKTIEAVNKAMESTKASAEVAADSAKSASESATQAEKEKESSRESAEKAAESKEAAATSATAAAESASQARESATTARSAADQAGKSATAAAESTTTATQQATNAAQSATNASGSAKSADQSAETAKTAADAAGKSASSAQQASRSAAESASTATAAAQTATTAAGNAAESVTLANQSAETAGQKATAAETAASSAADSATEAGKSATAAGDSASAAKASETAAGEAAQTAQEQADRIEESAEQIEKNKAGVAAVIIEESATGADIVISDSAEMPLKNLKLFGKSEQVTTTGKNLFDFSKIKNVGAQGKYDIDYERQTITVPANTNNVGYVNTMRELCPEATAGKMYVLSCNTSNSEAVRHIYLFEARQTIKFGKAFEWSDEMLDDKIAWYNNAKTDNENVISEIQFEEGTVATGYEPYTGGKPSPSPDFPQEIVSAGDSGNIEVEATGKNLLRIDSDMKESNCSKSNDNATKRIIKPGEYVVGLAGNNGVNENAIGSFEFSTNRVKFFMKSSSYSGFGIGVGIFLTSGKTYKIVFTGIGGNENVQVSFYSDDGTYINSSDRKNTVFTVPDNAEYSVVVFRNYAVLNTYFDFKDVMICEQGDNVSNAYEPYHNPQILDFTTPNGFRGIPVDSNGNYTDENGQQWVCDEVNFEHRVYIQRVWRGEFDGSDDENWGTYEIPKYLGFVADILPEKVNRRRGFCNYYIVQEEKNVSDAESLWLGVSGNTGIYLHNSRFYDAELGDKGLSNFKAYLAEHPLVIMTYLDTPIETPIATDQITAYKSFTTHKTTTLISNDAGAGMEVTYVADPKAYIDNKFAELSQAIVASASEAE